MKKLSFSFRTQSARSDNSLNYNLWFYIFVFGFYISARRFFHLPETPPRATLKGRTTLVAKWAIPEDDKLDRKIYNGFWYVTNSEGF